MKTIIVAKYKENIDWMKNLPADWQNIVISKDEAVPVLPNVGREPHTFFWAMEQLMRAGDVQDDEVFAFVQGWPFDHSPNLLRSLEEPCKGFRWLSEHPHTSDGNGAPAHHGLPVAACYEEWFGKPFPGKVNFFAGCQFMIDGATLKKRTAEEYAAMCKAMETDKLPWVMERLWEEFFK